MSTTIAISANAPRNRTIVCLLSDFATQRFRYSLPEPSPIYFTHERRSPLSAAQFIPKDELMITQAEDTIAVGFDEVRQAVERLAPWVHCTPVMTSRTLDTRSGGSVFLKCENLQRVGAFKFRGATNALLQLTEVERGAGVITHSSGNHAQAL